MTFAVVFFFYYFVYLRYIISNIFFFLFCMLYLFYKYKISNYYLSHTRSAGKTIQPSATTPFIYLFVITRVLTTFHFQRFAGVTFIVRNSNQQRVACRDQILTEILKNQHLKLSSISLEAECGAELNHDDDVRAGCWGGLTTCVRSIWKLDPSVYLFFWND